MCPGRRQCVDNVSQVVDVGEGGSMQLRLSARCTSLPGRLLGRRLERLGLEDVRSCNDVRIGTRIQKTIVTHEICGVRCRRPMARAACREVSHSHCTFALVMLMFPHRKNMLFCELDCCVQFGIGATLH